MVDCGEMKVVLFWMLGVLFMLWFMFVFFVGVLVLMVFDYLGGMWIIVMIFVVVFVLVIGWKLVKCGVECEWVVVMLVFVCVVVDFVWNV